MTKLIMNQQQQQQQQQFYLARRLNIAKLICLPTISRAILFSFNSLTSLYLYGEKPLRAIGV